MDKVVIFTDGASKGNPGEASIGVVIEMASAAANQRFAKDSGLARNSGATRKEYSQYLGKATNNEAEYQAMIFALKKLKSLLGSKKAGKTKVLLKSDSQLITSQLRGEFEVKEPEFFPLFIKIWNLKQSFAKVEFETIPREKNRLADKLANAVFSQEKLF